jgi:hypothetical protein
MEAGPYIAFGLFLLDALSICVNLWYNILT